MNNLPARERFALLRRSVRHAESCRMAFPKSPTLGVFLAFALCGCAPEADVRTYEVPHTPENQPYGSPERANEPKYRMLAGIIPMNDKENWFVRMDGPIEKVTALEKDFDAFLNSIRVTGKDSPPLTWTVPEGWRVGKPATLRLITLSHGEGTEQMDMYISDPISGSLLGNVNRWRTQFAGLPKVGEEELFPLLTPVQLGNIPAMRIDIRGPGMKQQPRMRPPSGTN